MSKNGITGSKMIAYNKIDFMEPTLENMYRAFKYRADIFKINFILTSVARTMQMQLALVAQGRMDVEEVNKYRRIAELPPITRKDNKIVTWTINSAHIIKDGVSRAFDIAVLDQGKHATWNLKVDVNNDKKPDYFQLGKIWEEMGGEWGGNYPTPDYCHFQLKS